MLLQWLSSSRLYCCYFSYTNTLKSKEAEFYPIMRHFALSKSIQWVGGKMGNGTVRLIGAQLSWHFHMWLNQSSLSSVCVGDGKGIASLQPHKSLLDTFKVLQKLKVGWLVVGMDSWLVISSYGATTTAMRYIYTQPRASFCYSTWYSIKYEKCLYISVLGSAFISVLFLKKTMRAADILGK